MEQTNSQQWKCKSCKRTITQEQAQKHDESFWCTICIYEYTGVHIGDNNTVVCPKPTCAMTWSYNCKFCSICATKLPK